MGNQTDDKRPIVLQQECRGKGDDKCGDTRGYPHPQVAAELEVPVEIDNADLQKPSLVRSVEAARVELLAAVDLSELA